MAAEEGDVVVIIDVLSCPTSVSLTVGRGATALSYSAQEIDRWGGREAICEALGAEIVARDRAATDARFSLSPASLDAIGPDDRLIFTSLNGATCTSAARRAPLVVVGCLLNGTAVAHVVAEAIAAGKADRCTLAAAAEHWSSTTDRRGTRPGVEDFLGVGAIAADLMDLGIEASPEAGVAAAAFLSAQPRLGDLLGGCVSGRELIDRGFAADVANSTPSGPVLTRSNDLGPKTQLRPGAAESEPVWFPTSVRTGPLPGADRWSFSLGSQL